MYIVINGKYAIVSSLLQILFTDSFEYSDEES